MSKLEEIKEQFHLSRYKLERLITDIQQELEVGQREKNAMLKCLPTFVTCFPNQWQTGQFLVIDLGGTNLRVGMVIFEGNGEYTIDLDHYELSRYLNDPLNEHDSSSPVPLFDLLARDVQAYLAKQPSDMFDVPWKLGFCFSYPVQQENLMHGRLLKCNKAFNRDDLIGRDVVSELQQALNNIGLSNVHVMSLVNDTVGTLVAHIYKETRTKMSLVLGTGMNAAYIEKVENISKENIISCKICKDASMKMVLNSEMGGFGDGRPEYLPLTSYDRQIDKNSINPGQQLFEKMISGMYLGELFAAIIGDIFGYRSCEITASTKVMSMIEEDPQVCNTELLCCATDLEEWEKDEMAIICRLISDRAAGLAAATVIAIYNHLSGTEKLDLAFVVAIDGSLFHRYFRFSERMNAIIQELAPPGANIILQSAMDESSVGAAAALLAHEKCLSYVT